MRSTTALSIGLAAGVAAGWLAGSTMGRGGGEAGDTAGHEGRLDDEPTAPGVLRGSGGGLKSPLSAEMSNVLRSLERAHPGGVGARSLAALAQIQAAAGDEQEFLRLAERALAQGVRLDELLDALAEFPAERRGALLEALLDRHKDGAFDAAEVGRRLADWGKAERALALVRTSLPKQNGFDAELSRLFLRLDPKGAARSLLALEGSDRWDSDSLGTLRALLIEADQEIAFVPFLERTLDAHPADHTALRWLRKIDPAGAEARLGALLRKNPDDPRAWSILGEIRRDAGDAGGAFDAFRRAAEKEPGRSAFRDLVRADPARGLELVVAWTKDSADDEMIGALGEMYLLAGRRDDAIRTFLRASEHDAKDLEWIDRLVEIDPASAIAAVEKRIGSAPGAARDELLGRYGDALRAAGRKDEAFEQYVAAHRRDPSDDDWQRAMVDLDAAAALPILEAHARENPADASGHGSLGLALAASGRGADAASELERALAGGDARRWYPALAKVDPDRALAGLEQRARADATDGDVWALLGQELRARQRTAEARAAYEHAARLDPANRDWARALRDLR